MKKCETCTYYDTDRTDQPCCNCNGENYEESEKGEQAITDNEIKKALKALLELVLVEGCLQRAKTISNALDLINRLQAEIKDLQKVVVDDYASEYDNKIKAEAYKEFAEKANEIIDLIVNLMFDDSVSKCQLPNCHKPSSIPCENEICIQENKEYWHSKLDNLLKERGGEK